jgi:hypothetical protein
MSYVGGVENDIFLSYAHGNPSQRKWSLEVERMLGDALNTHLGDRAHELTIFTDEKKLKGNGVIDELLKPEVQSSAVLLLIMTDHYVQSPSCLAELGWFQEKAKTFERIFIIRATNVPANKWPNSLTVNGQTVFGYTFCDDRADALPYGMFNQQEELGQSIVKLSAELAQFLRDRRAKSTQKPPDAAAGVPVPSIVKPDRRPQVLIGFVIEELEEQRKRLAESLATTHELQVLAPPFPDAANEVHDIAEAAAKAGAALVQLCGAGSGRWRRTADGYVADQISVFEAARRPTWLMMADGVDLKTQTPSPYVDFLEARKERFKRIPTGDELLLMVRPLPGTIVPSCTIYIQSRKAYEAIERSLREQIGSIREKKLVDALPLPVPPLYTIQNEQQLLALTAQRSANIQAGLEILGDRPDFLLADLLDYRQDKEAGVARWPAAIIAAPDAPSVTKDDVGGYPVFSLKSPAFDTEFADWLRGCLAEKVTP